VITNDIWLFKEEIFMTTPPRLHDINWLRDIIQKQKPFTMVCLINDTELFESDGDYLTVFDGINEKNMNLMLSSIDRAGARAPYRCELYPSAQSQLSERQERLGVMYSNLDRSFSGVPPFKDWVIEWIDGRIVAPDTSIILHHYLSEVILPRIRPCHIRIQIPHLVLLEIEAKGNRSSTEKRLSLSAFDEIRRLRLEAGATSFTRPLDTTLMLNFSQISGRRRVDEFIRREIRDQMTSGLGPPARNEQIVLLTRDLMMASVASAEDIDAFYFCPAKPEMTEFSITTTILAKIILETAVTFEKIRIEGLFKDSAMICKGMWSGKTLMDWYKKRLRVSFQKTK